MNVFRIISLVVTGLAAPFIVLFTVARTIGILFMGCSILNLAEPVLLALLFVGINLVVFGLTSKNPTYFSWFPPMFNNKLY
jgi:hypothetical protein